MKEKYSLRFLLKNYFLNKFINFISDLNFKNSIYFYNIIFRLNRKNISFGFNRKKDLFYIKESSDKHYFSNKLRGFNLYSGGLVYRSNQISESYRLNKIIFKFEDIVIDCGSNYGDLWLYLKNKINICNYYTFEPGINEFKALIENVSNAKNYNLGLGECNSIKKFFLNEENADSSIIEPIEYQRIEEIKITSLNSFLINNQLEKIKLLKLEAEGYEPEILLGADKVLNKIEYIALDGGNERGKDLKETLSTQLNLLLKNNFEIIEIDLLWGRALLKNQYFKYSS